jgi:hypothetical protein
MRVWFLHGSFQHTVTSQGIDCQESKQMPGGLRVREAKMSAGPVDSNWFLALVLITY